MIILGGFDGNKLNDVYFIKLEEAEEEEKMVSFSKKDLVQSAKYKWVHIRSQGTTFSPRTGHEAILYNHHIYVFAGTDDVVR